MDINTMVRIADITRDVAGREGGVAKVEWDLMGVFVALLKVRKAEEEFVIAWEKVCGPLDAELPTFPVEVLDFFPNAMRPVAEWHHEAGDSVVLAAYLTQIARHTACDEEADAILGAVKEWAKCLTLGQRCGIVVQVERNVCSLRDILDRMEDDPSGGDLQTLAIQINFVVSLRGLVGRLRYADLISAEAEAVWAEVMADAHAIWEKSSYQGQFDDPVLNTFFECGGSWWTRAPNAPLPAYAWYEQGEYEDGHWL